MDSGKAGAIYCEWCERCEPIFYLFIISKIIGNSNIRKGFTLFTLFTSEQADPYPENSGAPPNSLKPAFRQA